MKWQKKSKEYKQSYEHKYKVARNCQYAFSFASWLALICPDCILIGINWDEWITTQTDAIKVGTGLVLCIILSVFALYKKFSKDFHFSGLTAVIGFWIGFGICILIQSILQELTTILLYTAIGMTSSFLLDIPAKYYKKQKKKIAIAGNINLARSEAFGDFLGAIKEASGVDDKKGKDDKYVPVD